MAQHDFSSLEPFGNVVRRSYSPSNPGRLDNRRNGNLAAEEESADLRDSFRSVA